MDALMVLTAVPVATTTIRQSEIERRKKYHVERTNIKTKNTDGVQEEEPDPPRTLGGGFEEEPSGGINKEIDVMLIEAWS